MTDSPEAITIVRVPVKSSTIISVGYDDATQTLEVEFTPRKDGTQAIFRYHPRTRVFFDSLTSGEQSVGRAIHAMIRSREATVTKIS